jgi:hypothetical protein
MAGIAVTDSGSKRNRLNLNVFGFNGGVGIDLGADGPTDNDALDADGGPNLMQNYPILKRVRLNGKVKGKLQSAPNKLYTIDLFATEPCDGSGYGEGALYMASSTVMTDASGVGRFSVVLDNMDPSAGIAALATDPKGNTSEFSLCKYPN